jgi:hypothetical protein
MTLDEAIQAAIEHEELGSYVQQGCSVLCGNAPIRLVGADIASPDLKSPSYQGLKSPSCQGLKSPSYQGLTLVYPGVRVHGGVNPKVHDIRGAERVNDNETAGVID